MEHARAFRGGGTGFAGWCFWFEAFGHVMWRRASEAVDSGCTGDTVSTPCVAQVGDWEAGESGMSGV